MNSPKRPLPVLYLKSSNEQEWTLVATIIGNEQPLFKFDGTVEKDWVVWEMGPEKLYAFQFIVPRGKVSEYNYEDQIFEIAVPDAKEKIRLSLSACNGYEAEDLENPVASRSQAWEKMLQIHRKRPYHLMLQMGDQIYNDKVWESHPEQSQMASHTKY